MTKARYSSPGRPPKTVAARVRRRVEASHDRVWRIADFGDLPGGAVEAALGRLVRDGTLTRPRRGIYYRPRSTVLGPSEASFPDLVEASIREPIFPAGLSASSSLGFTTQNPSHYLFSTTSGTAPVILSGNFVVPRRPHSWRRLTAKEGAILELLRGRGEASDLPEQETVRRMLSLLSDPRTFKHLIDVAADEPARVRAMLGALGQELGIEPRQLLKLKKTLSPLSKYDFGKLRALRFAKDWHAR